MPAPSTYIDITAFPFSRLVTIAEFNAGTFGGTVNTVWFRYVAAATGVFGINPNFENNKTMRTSIYQSDGTTLIRSNSTGNSVDIRAVSGTTYYIKVNVTAGGVVIADFTVTADVRTYLATIDLGDLIVNDDSAGGGVDFPAAILDPLTGEVQGYIESMNSGEFGAILDNGRMLLDNTSDVLKLYDKDGVFVTTVVTVGGGTRVVTAVGNTWYVLLAGDIYSVSTLGVLSAVLGSIVGPDASSFGVSPDESKFYYTFENDANVYWQTFGSAVVNTLYTAPGYSAGFLMCKTVNDHATGELLPQSDGSFVVWYIDPFSELTELFHISAAGAELAHYTYANLELDHLQRSPLGDGYIVVWFQNAALTVGTFGTLDLATGAFTQSFDVPMWSQFKGTGTFGKTNLFGPSQSCIFLVYKNEVAPTTGTVVVQKVTAPGTSLNQFIINAGGGLSPALINLADGESYIFNDVTPGTGYSIIEDPTDGWIISYNVNTGDPNTNFEVVAGETVIITITNTLDVPAPNLRSGIYKIVPNKRNDTLWLQDFSGTEDVKIP